MNISVDLNCDMGEGMAHDAEIMPYITSANIACGFHAGDETIMHETIELALANRVKIGAHPSFPDRENFGRTVMYFPPNELADIVKKQIEILAKIASKNHVELHHVKPHGALYNLAAKNEETAEAICKAILSINPLLKVYAQSGSALSKIAQKLKLGVCHEGFADRTYQADGTLTPRTEKNALLYTEQEVVEQVLQMVQKQRVTTNRGEIPIQVDTICVHGDGEYALPFIKAIYQSLRLNHINIQAIL